MFNLLIHRSLAWPVFRKWHFAVPHLSLLTFLLIYSVEQSPCEATRFFASQEISRILWNPKVHYSVCKNLSVSGVRSIQTMPSHPTSWRSNLVLFSHLCLGLLSGLFLSGFLTKTLYAPLLPHTCYMPLPSHSRRFDHPNNIWWGVQIIKLLIM